MRSTSELEAIVKADVATLGPPKLAQFLHEYLDTPFRFRIGLRNGKNSTPTRRIRSGCCARAASGHAATPPPSSVLMNFRRAIIRPNPKTGLINGAR